MILTDSSVWISHFQGHETPAVAKLSAAIRRDQVLVGDLMLLEILQGARSDLHATRIERELRRYRIVTLLNDELAVRAAQNYRRLRDLGITIRKTADLVIGTFCIAHGHTLLHADRDFAPMETHLGLKCA